MVQTSPSNSWRFKSYDTFTEGYCFGTILDPKILVGLHCFDDNFTNTCQIPTIFEVISLYTHCSWIAAYRRLILVSSSWVMNAFGSPISSNIDFYDFILNVENRPKRKLQCYSRSSRWRQVFRSITMKILYFEPWFPGFCRAWSVPTRSPSARSWAIIADSRRDVRNTHVKPLSVTSFEST